MRDARTINHARILVIGLGNPILGDDGVGWKIAEQVAERLSKPTRVQLPILSNKEASRDTIEIDCLAVGGLSLMERLVGYDRAILIDAITSGKSSLGTVSCFPIEALPNRAAGHLGSAHDTTLQNALQVGRTMGAHLPDQITIVAIEAVNLYEFSEVLTPAVATAVPQAVRRVMEILQVWQEEFQYEIGSETTG